MNSLTIEELNILSNNDKLEELLKEKQINIDITINDIIERISKRVVNIILISQVLKNTNTKKLGDILLSERIDIFLSYLDETIETSSNKKELILFKYKYIFALPNVDEKRIVERNFATDKTIYLSSLMYFQILQVNPNIYKSYKDAMAKGILDEMLDAIKNNTDIIRRSQGREIAYTDIRTSFNMMSDELFNEIKQKQFEEIRSVLSLFLDNSHINNFIETVTNDRERHKVLSLIPPKNGI